MLRRGRPRWLAINVERIRAAYALPPGQNRAAPVGLAAPVHPEKIRQIKSEFIVIIFVAIGYWCSHSYACSGVRDSDDPDASSEVDPLEGARKTPCGPILRF